MTDKVGVENLIEATLESVKRFVLTTSAGVLRSDKFPFAMMNMFSTWNNTHQCTCTFGIVLFWELTPLNDLTFLPSVNLIRPCWGVDWESVAGFSLLLCAFAQLVSDLYLNRFNMSLLLAKCLLVHDECRNAHCINKYSLSSRVLCKYKHIHCHVQRFWPISEWRRKPWKLLDFLTLSSVPLGWQMDLTLLLIWTLCCKPHEARRKMSISHLVTASQEKHPASVLPVSFVWFVFLEVWVPVLIACCLSRDLSRRLA